MRLKTDIGPFAVIGYADDALRPPRVARTGNAAVETFGYDMTRPADSRPTALTRYLS